MKTAFDEMMADPTAMTQLGLAIGTAMSHANHAQNNAQLPQYFQKEASLTPGTVSIYGRMSLFSPCSPGDVFGLQVETHGLMAWLGWRANKYYSRRVDFLTYMGPAGTSDGTATTGATDPCADPPGWEYGSCGYNLIHKSWYARAGDALSPHTIVQDRCETSPRYRINGKLITDDMEWQMNGMMTALEQSIRRDQVHGSHSNANEMNGLESLIVTGYDDDEGNLCPMVDSITVDWANDDLDGDVNGYGNFFDYMDEIVTELEWRASAIGGISESDMILLTSRFMATCLLDSYACYTTCGVTSTSDITDQALRAQQRAMRRDLNGGPLYDGRTAVGYIHLKSGRRLPIMVEDVLDVTRFGATTNYCTDIYLLTRRIGSQDVLYGEFLDLRVWENRVRAKDTNFRGKADASGRFAVKGKEDNFCTQMIIGTSPEIYLSAPWAQVRIQDVCCSRQRQPLVGDPFQGTYLPGGSNLYPAYTYNPQLQEG